MTSPEGKVEGLGSGLDTDNKYKAMVYVNNTLTQQAVQWLLRVYQGHS